MEFQFLSFSLPGNGYSNFKFKRFQIHQVSFRYPFYNPYMYNIMIYSIIPVPSSTPPDVGSSLLGWTSVPSVPFPHKDACLVRPRWIADDSFVTQSFKPPTHSQTNIDSSNMFNMFLLFMRYRLVTTALSEGLMNPSKFGSLKRELLFALLPTLESRRPKAVRSAIDFPSQMQQTLVSVLDADRLKSLPFQTVEVFRLTWFSHKEAGVPKIFINSSLNSTARGSAGKSKPMTCQLCNTNYKALNSRYNQRAPHIVQICNDAQQVYSLHQRFASFWTKWIPVGANPHVRRAKPGCQAAAKWLRRDLTLL